MLAGLFSIGTTALAQPQFGASQNNPFSLTDIGDWSAPEFVDLDNDGDLDVMAGEQGGDWYYFENTGTATAPAFAAAVNNPFGLTTIGTTSSCDFGDMDDDGDLDLVGLEMGGAFKYFENTGSVSAPAFGGVQTNPFGLTSSGPGVYHPTVGDIDGDGANDIMPGTIGGDFKLYRNVGTAAAPAYGPVATNPFGLANQGSLASPEFGDLDMDGDLDIISGENSGTGDFKYYENTGSASGPTWAAVVTNPFSLTAIGGNVMEPSFGDLDDDTDLDLIVGNTTGGFYYFENTSINAGVTETALTAVSIWPNPTNGMLTVSLDKTDKASYSVSNLAGQVIAKGTLESVTSVVDLTSVQTGIYLMAIENKGKTTVHKVVVK